MNGAAIDPTGEADRGALRLDFDCRLMLGFRGFVITSEAGLLAYRELDDVLALTATGGEGLADARTGKNRPHLLVGLLRRSVFGRLAGYEDVNDAARVCRDPGDALGGLDLRRFSGEALGQPAACFSNCAGLEKSRAEWRRTGL